MMPYYDDGTCTIYHGDCREVLPSFARESVDLIVTDPPYGQNWQSGWRKNSLERIPGDDGNLDVGAALAFAVPALRRQRHLYVFGRPDLSRLPLGPTVELVWDKGLIGGGDLSLPWGLAHEPVQFAVHVPMPSDRVRGKGGLAARLRQCANTPGRGRSPLEGTDVAKTIATPEQRYEKKVDRTAGPDACHPWTRAVSSEGYGYFCVDSKTIKAHRYGWQLANGPIPDGLHVCHSCDNPPCQNQKHWFLGTTADNNADRNAKGRQAKGERNSGAKLTAVQVSGIRRRYAAGGVTQTQLGDAYGIDQTTVSRIVLGQSWGAA